MLNFQPHQPRAVQAGSHTTPQGGGGGFNFFDALGGAGQGYLTGGLEGALAGFAGNAFGGGQQTQAPQTTSRVPTSQNNSPSGLQNADEMMLQSQRMTPGVGQTLDSMAPENRIGGNQSGMQAADQMMQAAMADPYINPHLWELPK